VERLVDDSVAQVRGFFLGFLVADNFDADHQTFAAHIANDLEALRPVIDAAEHVVAQLPGVFHVAILDEVESSHCRGDAHGVSAVGAAVGPLFPGHHAFFGDECAQRHAAGNPFSGANDVRLDSGMFVGPPFSGAPDA
jgi:hypothetical protein